MFFNYVKNKIRNKNILWSIISIVVMFVAVLLAISNGFSSETEWKYGFRFSDTGIPIPNWVISCLFIIIALIFLGLLISSVKDLFTNTTYNKIIKAAQEIGDISFIDQTLQNLQKNNLAKGGDLRYNNFLFFYMKGTEVFLFPTKSITSIQPIKETGKNTECYVNVRSATENVKIYTKELNLVPLANDILYYVRAAQ